MTKTKKIFCIILAGLIAVSAFSGTLFYILSRYKNTEFTVLKYPANTDNYVNFKNGVHIADASCEIQKHFDTVSVNNDEYIIVYKKALPNFFRDMKVGDVFCVYPDSTAAESFFALGFCGRLTSISSDNIRYAVSFTIPELTDVFSDIYINTCIKNNLIRLKSPTILSVL